MPLDAAAGEVCLCAPVRVPSEGRSDARAIMFECADTKGRESETSRKL